MCSFLISLLCSTPSSLSFMNLYSLYMLHDRSRQSTKTCAECHTCSLVGYGGGILDDISILTSLWGAERRNIESKGLFRWYKGSYELLGIEQDIPCDLISVVSYFSQLCVFMCAFLKYVFFRLFSPTIFPFFHFIFKSTIFLSRETLLSRETRGEPPPDVVSGENVTLPSSFIALRREAITTMIFSPSFVHTYSLFRFRFSFYFHSTKY